MPTYLVEAYGANSDNALADARERALRAAELAGEVRYLRTTYLPQDEVLLHAFEAPSRDVLGRAVRLAALPYERIVEAVERTIVEAEGERR